MTLETLLEIDKNLLLWFNGSNNMFVDELALLLTSGTIWIPFYLALLMVVVKNNEKWGQICLVILTIGLCMLISNGLNGGLIKPMVGRLRPSFEPQLQGIVQLVHQYKAGGYSFFSAHACNTFSIAVFMSLLIRSKMLTFALFSWAAINAWTRLYLGVHYPSDVLVGTLVGMLLGAFCYMFYMHFYLKITMKINYVSSHYTKMGYQHTDIDIALLVYTLTFAYAIIHALVLLQNYA